MSRYTAWKTVTTDGEKKHRSENATYKWLREWASEQPDDVKADVYVQETGSDRWHVFANHIVRDGYLNEA